MTVLYLIRLFNLVFMGEPHAGLVKEGSRTMLMSVLALGVLSLVSGIIVYYPFKVVQAGVLNLAGLVR